MRTCWSYVLSIYYWRGTHDESGWRSYWFFQKVTIYPGLLFQGRCQRNRKRERERKKKNQRNNKLSLLLNVLLLHWSSTKKVTPKCGSIIEPVDLFLIFEMPLQTDNCHIRFKFLRVFIHFGWLWWFGSVSIRLETKSRRILLLTYVTKYDMP